MLRHQWRRTCSTLRGQAMFSEQSVGITGCVSPGKGFLAATKQRWSDFIVREVDLQGRVVRLTKPATPPTNRDGKEWLGFTLYKENVESNFAMARLAEALKVKPSAFTVAGTKDKRGVTTQRVHAYRVHPGKLAQCMASAPFGDAIVAGNLTFEAAPLQRGALGGNAFTVVLRDCCDCPEDELQVYLRQLQSGFVNYFGLQRFGSPKRYGAHLLGSALLRGDYAAVVEMILAPIDGVVDDPDVAEARAMWARRRDARATLELMPRRRATERHVLSGVLRHGESSWHALDGVPQAVRSLYVHAFQSFLFNHAASERLRLYSCEWAVAGDLVWPKEWSTEGSEARAPTLACEEEKAVTAQMGSNMGGESGGEDGSEGGREDSREGGNASQFAVPHVVTDAEAAAGTYGIEDVLLTLPGHKALLPQHSVARKYTRLLADHGLSTSAFDHPIRSLAVRGSYRSLLVRPQHLRWNLMRYDDPTIPLALTDLDISRGLAEPEGVPSGRRLAVRLEFTLPPSSYATMCVRELTKQSSNAAHQRTLNVPSASKARASRRTRSRSFFGK